MSDFKNRVYGCAVIKSINSNYNADFSHQPRTLPDGRVYATDKALKYSIKNYIKDLYPEETLFFFKRLREEDMIPMSLEDAYEHVFPEDEDGTDKKVAAKNILSCIDARLFGATFAKKGRNSNVAFSIHGPVQINHGINIWPENDIYSEQIMSPFRNPGDANSEDQDKNATTLGRQSKLREGHYLHHLSINPTNLDEIVKLAGEDAETISDEDIKILKNALRNGVTYYDSSAKAGTDNELLIWIQLNKDSKTVLPNLTELVSITRDNGNYKFNIKKVNNLIEKYGDKEIESVEIYYSPESTQIAGAESTLIQQFDLETGNEI